MIRQYDEHGLLEETYKVADVVETEIVTVQLLLEPSLGLAKENCLPLR